MPFQKTFGVDLGTSMVKIYSQQQDSVFCEKNMIAIRNGKQVLAVGNEAFEMFEKTPTNVEVITPMSFGKIADINHAEMVLHRILEQTENLSTMGNTFYLAVPADISEIEKRAYHTIGNFGKRTHICMVEKTIADAVALGIPINKTRGTMIVNIGAQSSEISIIEQGRVVISKIVEIGGKQLNEAIANMVRRRFNLTIGSRTARRLKFSLAYLRENTMEACKVVGMDSLCGLPREGIVPAGAVHDAIVDPLNAICEEIAFFLKRTPPQIYNHITEEGIFLTGGTTKIPGIDWYVSQKIGQRVRLSSYYDLCTISGLKEIIGNKTLHKWVKE